MARSRQFQLVQDRRGMMWDLLLYIPTVIALLSIGIKLWYGPNQTWAYVLIFMASFFFLVGANRILSSRMLLLPGAPVGLSVDRQQVSLQLHNGSRVELVKNVRYFPDYSGKSFGLSGMDLSGKRRQFVFHRGQFAAPGEFNDARACLSVYK